MSLVIATAHANLATEIDALSTEELRRELTTGLGRTAGNLLRLALVIKTLEDRGEDLSGIRVGGLLNHLRRIACGQVLPEVVVHFAGSPMLIAMIGSLPIPDQRRLVSGKSVRLLTYSPDGKQTHRMADPLDMTPDQLRQVFARDHIRSDAEQALLLDQRRAKERGPKPEKVGKFNIDHARGGATHRGEFITLDELLAVVKAIRKK